MRDQRDRTVLFQRLFPLALLATPTVSFATNYTLTTIANFDISNGEWPEGGLVADANGDLFGTTYRGGASGDGTIFELPAGTHTIETLFSFDGKDGETPQCTLVADSAGNLYGTTTGGGNGGYGTIFEFSPATDQLTTLVNLDYLQTGYSPSSLTIDSHGNLYGAMQLGGSEAFDGNVFELPASTRAFTPIFSFSGSTGAWPSMPVTLDSKGDIFGTTSLDGQYNDGNVFEIPAGTNSLKILASFNPSTNGSNPSSVLSVDSQGDLFGANGGGDGITYDGTVFEVVAGSGQVTNLVKVITQNGDGPQWLIRDPATGILYGSTPGENLSLPATIFAIDLGSDSLLTLASIPDSNGANPNQFLPDGQGDFYGTTIGGGAGNVGSIYELSPVPEPASFTLIAGIGLASVRRRGRAVKRK